MYVIILTHYHCHIFLNRKEFEMGQMNSIVETEKNQVSQLQKMVKELQVFSFQISLCTSV